MPIYKTVYQCSCNGLSTGSNDQSTSLTVNKVLAITRGLQAGSVYAGSLGVVNTYDLHCCYGETHTAVWLPCG